MTRIENTSHRPPPSQRRRLPSLPIALFFLLLHVVSTTRAAAATALTFTGGDLLRTQGLVVGWRFTLSTPVTLSALGFYDLAEDGLNQPYHVGIFECGTHELRVSAIVPDGSGAPLSNGFRYTTSLIGNAILPMGEYVIAARAAGDYPTDDLARFQVPASNVMVPPEITCGAGMYMASPGLVYPTTVYYGSGWGIFGANFQYTSPVPEPGSLLLISAGVLLACRRRRV